MAPTGQSGDGTNPGPQNDGGSDASAMTVTVGDIDSSICEADEAPPPSWFSRFIEALIARLSGESERKRRREEEDRICRDNDGGSID